MLSSDEEAFLIFWGKNREKQKTSIKPFLVGLSAGFVLGISLIIIVATGWDQRATMVANSKLSSVVFLLAILIISLFMAFLYRNFRWETQEQRYLELLDKKQKMEKFPAKQP